MVLPKNGAKTSLPFLRLGKGPGKFHGRKFGEASDALRPQHKRKMERARRRLARNGGLDELGVLQASRLQEELTRWEVRRASEAVAAAKKNARLRLKREQKAAQRREELRQAYRREYDRGAVYLPPVLEPPKPPVPFTRLLFFLFLYYK
jgi:hypothetical protein